MNVLILAAHYLPGFKAGGPIRSIANLVGALGGEIDFQIITSDRDLGDDRSFDNITPDVWQTVGHAQVMYLSARQLPSRRLLNAIRAIRPDLIYLNSFFHPRTSGAVLAASRAWLLDETPILIAPRGEFSPGALAIRRWKKTPYIAAAKALGLTSGVAWHATSDTESHDIRRMMGPRARIFTATNLCESAKVLTRERRPKRPGQLHAVFLSRIVPKKNLLGALQILDDAARRVACSVELDIWGPIEDENYWRQCEEQIKRLPANAVAHYRGSARPDSITKILADYDALLLPTQGENFGHVIVESLTAGCPLVISDCTPWRNLKARGVGWDLPLTNPFAFREALAALLAMDEQAHAAMRHNAAQYGRQLTHDANAIDASRTMFLEAANRTYARLRAA